MFSQSDVAASGSGSASTYKEYMEEHKKANEAAALIESIETGDLFDE